MRTLHRIVTLTSLLAIAACGGGGGSGPRPPGGNNPPPQAEAKTFGVQLKALELRRVSNGDLIEADVSAIGSSGEITLVP